MVRIDAEARPSSATIVRASDVGTAVFCATAIASALALAQLKEVIVVVSLAYFVAGCAGFLWALAVAAERSRTDAIGMGGLFFLMGAAPRAIQLRLIGAFALQVAVAFATAGARPFTSQAFAVLAPMFGLGLMGLWGARFGQFASRPGVDGRR